MPIKDVLGYGWDIQEKIGKDWYEVPIDDIITQYEYNTKDYLYCIVVIDRDENINCSLYEIGEAVIGGVIYPHRRVKIEEIETNNIEFLIEMDDIFKKYSIKVKAIIRKRKIGKLLKEI